MICDCCGHDEARHYWTASALEVPGKCRDCDCRRFVREGENDRCVICGFELDNPDGGNACDSCRSKPEWRGEP